MNIFSRKDIQFNTLINSIQNFLQNNGVTVNLSTVFGQLLTVVSSACHNIMLYIEDSLVEQNKYTAQRKKSILGLAVQSGYSPSYGSAATVRLRLAHKSNNIGSSSVIIPDHTQLCCTKNGMYYSLILGTRAKLINRASAQLYNQYFTAVQGRFESQRFAPPGGNLTSVNLQYIGQIDEKYITVFVNGQEYEQVASLYDMVYNKKQFYIRYNIIGGVDICFGNKCHGIPIKTNDVIDVQYLLHDGESGNIDLTGDVQFLFIDYLKDSNGEEVDGNAIFTVSPQNNNSMTYGSDIEDTASLREMIGFNSRSLVLAHPNNYKEFLSHYSFVGYNRTWTEPGSLAIQSLVLSNFKQKMNESSDYFKLKKSDFHLTDMQKEGIKQAIIDSGKSLAGSVYDICDMDLAKYAAFLYITLKDGSADKLIIKNHITKVVGEFFSNLQSDSYIPKSDLINAIKNEIPEIDGVNCYFLSEKNETALLTGEYIDVTRTYSPATGTYKETAEKQIIYPGENPNIGLDEHGNIVVDKDFEFPVLMGGWKWLTADDQEVTVDNPLQIVFE